MAETLRNATAQATRSIGLLDRLLAREDAAPPGPISLLASLQFVASVYGSRHRSILLEIDWPAANPLPAVWGLSRDLELVLLNLILNSLQALGGRASGRIAVESGVRGSVVQVAISDDGIGVSSSVTPRLFEPFVSGWTAKGSQGLGLAASRIILARYGGTLAHAPGGETGARFILALPAVGPGGVPVPIATSSG